MFWSTLALSALLGTQAVAADRHFTFDVSTSTSSSVRCVTHYDTFSRMFVPTFSTTSTLRSGGAILFVTTTSTSTVTPAVSTQTSTVNTTSTVMTTAVTPTNNVTTTRTATTTSILSTTITNIATISATSTITTSTATTIPTPAGYMPMASVLGISVSSRKARKARREAIARAEAESKALPASPPPKSPAMSLKQLMNFRRYPLNVQCTTFLQVIKTQQIVRDAPAVTKTLTASTISVNQTQTFTVTSTVFPETVQSNFTASTTVTSLRTKTLTALTTTTTTNTVTLATTTSVYAACTGVGAIVPVSSGYNVKVFTGRLGGNAFGNTPHTSDTNAYDCCVACQLAGPSCGVAAFGGSYNWMLPSGCNLWTSVNNASPNTCAANQMAYQVGPVTQGPAAVANGPCGQGGKTT